MTSNAGAQRIIAPKNLGFAAKTDAEMDHKRMKDGVLEEVKRIFKPEFINRIDEMIVFHALNKTNLRQIVTILSKNLCERCKNQLNLTLTISTTVKDYLVEKHADLKMGARPLKRAIQTQLEDKLAEELLSGRIVPGEKISASLKKDEIVFVKK